MGRLTDKISEVGLGNAIAGMLKRKKYKKLSDKHGFDSWHISPYEHRKYAQVVAEYVNKQRCDGNAVIDVGCGMGEIISHISQKNCYGYDLDKTIIDVAKKVKTGSNVIFREGSFDEIAQCPEGRMDIEYMITLNFLHGSPEEKWVDSYKLVCDAHNIRHFIVDVLPEGVNGSHKLDFTKILPATYELVERMGPYLSGRYIEVYKKADI